MIKLYLMEISPLQDEKCFEQGLALVEPERREKIEKYGQEKSRMLGLAAGLLAGYGASEAAGLSETTENSEAAGLSETTGNSEAAGGCVTVGTSEAVSGKKEAPEWIWVTAGEAIMRLSTLAPVKIEKSPGGKPYFADRQGLFLSLSHSGEYAVCAVSDVPVGVDIQEYRKVKRNMLKRLLCPGEQIVLAERADTSERAKDGFLSAEETVDFFRFWTAKEACVKCTGAGLSKDFRELLADFEKCEIKDTVTGEHWRLYTAEEPMGYAMAICTF